MRNNQTGAGDKLASVSKRNKLWQSHQRTTVNNGLTMTLTN
ncbi:MAG: hypothetical protein KatS3mg028_1350 [Bacteroidia bacterium]|nr:MAG: hypothetical protein KatS3mg028_1350 [Bacteroidia bacterium]